MSRRVNQRCGDPTALLNFDLFAGVSGSKCVNNASAEQRKPQRTKGIDREV
jgi:hypothetical protein